MSWSKWNQVCIKRFRRSSKSWIFFSYTCITPLISKFKAYNDPGPLWWSYIHLTQFCLVISRCNITFSVFWLSQGNVATLVTWGGWNSCRHMCCSFLKLTMKTALKFVNIWRSYIKKTMLAPFFMADGVWVWLRALAPSDRRNWLPHWSCASERQQKLAITD